MATYFFTLTILFTTKMLNLTRHTTTARLAASGLMLAAILASSPSAAAQDDSASDWRLQRKTFGVKAGYITRNESAVAGLFFQYRFTDHFRLAPDVECAFSHNNRDAFMVNIDTHYPFEVNTRGNATIYPIAGVNYSSWKRRFDDLANDKDTSQKTTNFGLNLGAGFDLTLSRTLKLNLEARYTLVKHNSNLQVTVGIGYLF